MIRVLTVDDDICAVKEQLAGVHWKLPGVEQQIFPDKLELGRMPAVYNMTEWSDYIEQGDTETLCACLSELLQEPAFQPVTTQALVSLYHAFLQTVYYVLQRRGVSAILLYAGTGLQADSTASTRSVPAFKVWVEEMAQAVQGLLTSRNRGNSVVQQVKVYIAERLHEELTREQLAAHVFLNPAYLSRLFRKETGMALTGYILQERMRRAAHQLVTTDKSVSQIAGGLGYNNFSYFARLFRKIYTVTPHNYRKKVHFRA